ncbi:MAG: hypothetical protein PHU34_03425 [Candidatus Methanoperedens sp.]|nr:hypothetical protein [Candidatus Methanoperedens sp.]
MKYLNYSITIECIAAPIETDATASHQKPQSAQRTQREIVALCVLRG